MPVMSPWLMTASSSMTQMLWLKEREEDMETGAPASSTAPVPPKELPMQGRF